MTKEELTKFLEDNHCYKICLFSNRLNKEIIVAHKTSMFANHTRLLKEMPDGYYLYKRGDNIEHLLAYPNWKEMVDGKLWELLN